ARGGLAPPIITGLSADLVPPPLYATRHWFYATTNWYYHAAIPVGEDATIDGRGVHPRLNINDRFYELIAPHPRLLCRLINEAGPGFRTTPSCEGHFYGREHFERIWLDLKQQEVAIRGGGLRVRDSETDEPFNFRDGAYSLPWSEADTFCAEAGASQ